MMPLSSDSPDTPASQPADTGAQAEGQQADTQAPAADPLPPTEYVPGEGPTLIEVDPHLVVIIDRPRTTQPAADIIAAEIAKCNDQLAVLGAVQERKAALTRIQTIVAEDPEVLELFELAFKTSIFVPVGTAAKVASDTPPAA